MGANQSQTSLKSPSATLHQPKTPVVGKKSAKNYLAFRTWSANSRRKFGLVTAHDQTDSSNNVEGKKKFNILDGNQDLHLDPVTACCPIDQKVKHQQGSYYITPNSCNKRSSSASKNSSTGSANNYVIMQQPTITNDSSCALVGAGGGNQENEITIHNNSSTTNGILSGSFYTNPMDISSSSAGSYIGQNVPLLQDQCKTNGGGGLSRSQQQHPKQHQLPSSYQLSRAINTKTTGRAAAMNSSNNNNNNNHGNGIDNAVAMPNNTTHRSSLQQSKSSVVVNQNSNNNNNNNNTLTYQQSPYLQAPNELSQFYPHQERRDEQYYLRNLLDQEQLQQQQQQRLFYKSPRQQYQYINPVDFHQVGQQQCQLYQQSPVLASQRGLADYNRSLSFGASHTLGSRKRLGASQLFGQSANQQQQQQANQQRSNKSFSGSLKRVKSSPLSAQQASYEAMRTIDMYLIRQIARSCMDFEMEQRIDLEIRLRELAAQSMLEAMTEIDVLEVEKSLLASDQRMNYYASQLEEQRKQLSNPSLSTDSGRGSKSGHRHSQHRLSQGDVKTMDLRTSSPEFEGSQSSQSPSKLSPVSGESTNSPSSFDKSTSNRSRTATRYNSSSRTNTLSAKQKAKNRQREQMIQNITSLSNINCNMVSNSRASLSIGEIRIPLMWRDVDHFKNRGDYKRYAIFCLLKLDSQIYDTQLISDVDRQVTDVTFDDLLVFNEVEHNFELKLEVYSCVYLEEFSLSSTPRKLKEKLTSSVSRAMGRRLATQTASANYTKELQAYDKSYRFQMIASASLRLQDSSHSVKTYDLVLVSPSAHHRHKSDSQQSTPNSKEANKNTLPLFGHFCCKLSVKPDVFDKNVKTGYLRVAIINVPSNNNGNTAAHRSSNNISPSTDSTASSIDSASLIKSALVASSKMATLSKTSSTLHWALLRNFALHLWPVDEDRISKSALLRGELPPGKPGLVIAIDKFARLLRVSNSSLTLEANNCCFVLATFCPDSGSWSSSSLDEQASQTDELSKWLRCIEQQIYDSHIWGSALDHHKMSGQSQLLGSPAASLGARMSSSSGHHKRSPGYGRGYGHKDYYSYGGAVLQADL